MKYFHNHHGSANFRR